jgi:hypothetical protein
MSVWPSGDTNARWWQLRPAWVIFPRSPALIASPEETQQADDLTKRKVPLSAGYLCDAANASNRSTARLQGA